MFIAALAPCLNNEFVPLPPGARSDNFPRLARQLARQSIRYLYVRESNKAAFTQTTDPIIRRWRSDRLAAENYLLRGAQPIYRVDDCSLYRLAEPLA
jgi:hypothetical protein